MPLQSHCPPTLSAPTQTGPGGSLIMGGGTHRTLTVGRSVGSSTYCLDNLGRSQPSLRVSALPLQ